MMQQELQKWAREYQTNKDIFDIVLFGSYTKGKKNPSDIDLAIIFKSLPLKDRLIFIQEMKKKLPQNIKYDFKGILLTELFDPAFFGRTGIVWEGLSLFNNRPFAQRMGFLPKALFIYDLKDKSHTEKVKINYILKGRKREGMIQKLKGKHEAPGVVEIPFNNVLEFEDILKKQNIQFQRKNILVQE